MFYCLLLSEGGLVFYLSAYNSVNSEGMFELALYYNIVGSIMPYTAKLEH